MKRIWLRIYVCGIEIKSYLCLFVYCWFDHCSHGKYSVGAPVTVLTDGLKLFAHYFQRQNSSKTGPDEKLGCRHRMRSVPIAVSEQFDALLYLKLGRHRHSCLSSIEAPSNVELEQKPLDEVAEGVEKKPKKS